MGQMTIAIDAMSGDLGYSVVIPGVIEALGKHPNLVLILVGDSAILHQKIEMLDPGLKSRLIIQPASEIVAMDESPTKALRYKKDSSLRVTINLVKEGRAQACVSAGNTGALMATAHFVLKTLPGIDRPAILKAIPASGPIGVVRILDLGANVESTPEVLKQFAMMGSVLSQAISQIEKPKVALLNMSSYLEDDTIGNAQVKAADQLLKETGEINYIGFVQAHQLFSGIVDVIVCDGFVGNVALKAIEGEAKLIGQLFKKAATQSWIKKFLACFSLFVFNKLKSELKPDKYNGASFVGLKGVVIKSHGHTSPEGFATAIEEAMLEIKRNVPGLIQEKMARLVDPLRRDDRFGVVPENAKHLSGIHISENGSPLSRR